MKNFLKNHAVAAGVCVALGLSAPIAMATGAEAGIGVHVGPVGVGIGGPDYYTCYHDDYSPYYCNADEYNVWYTAHPGWNHWGRFRHDEHERFGAFHGGAGHEGHHRG